MKNKTNILNCLCLVEINARESTYEMHTAIQENKKVKTWGRRPKALIKRIKKCAELLLDQINVLNTSMMENQ